MRLVGREEKDGTYLLRPFGDLPFVYHADKLVTGRLIKFYRKANSWVFWGALLSGALALPVLLNFWSDHLFLATVIFLVGTCAVESVGVVAGVLFILRHALRVPAATFPTPKPKAEPVRWRWLRVAATIAISLSLVDMFFLPQQIPFSDWIDTALIAFALIVFVADHVRRQRQQSGAPPAPPKIDNRAVQRRRMLWGTLLGPLINPLALSMPLMSETVAEIDNVFGIVGILLAWSYGLGLALVLVLLLGWGRRGLWWYLGAAAVATLVMTPFWVNYVAPHFSSGMEDEVLWVGTMTGVFIAFPAAIAFWLIARPDRWSLDMDSSGAAKQPA
jgi:hypothetical protein